jgi:anti-sigma factor RsiW
MIDTSDNPHDEAEELLPWYVTGRLDAADRERVEKHLTDCARCQAELRAERRLADEYRAYSPQVEASWLSLRERIEPAIPAQPPAAANSNWWHSLSRPAMGGLIAAQLAVVVATAGIVSYFDQPDGAYRALGSAPVAASANAVVIFQPTTREDQLRRLLNASDAELVGGPTEADAYVLHVPAETRTATLARLRARPEVVMAEPIDGQTP